MFHGRFSKKNRFIKDINLLYFIIWKTERKRVLFSYRIIEFVKYFNNNLDIYLFLELINLFQKSSKLYKNKNSNMIKNDNSVWLLLRWNKKTQIPLNIW